MLNIAMFLVLFTAVMGATAHYLIPSYRYR